MVKNTKVERPTKNSEYELRFASANAQKAGGTSQPHCGVPLADTWDFLTRTRWTSPRPTTL